MQDSPPAVGRFSDTLPLRRSAILSGAFFCHRAKFPMTEKECGLAHSRAERGRLRHISSSRECTSRGAFLCHRTKFPMTLEKRGVSAPVPRFENASSLCLIESEPYGFILSLYAVFCPRYLGMDGIQAPSAPTKYPSGVYSLQYMEPCGLPSWYTGFR